MRQSREISIHALLAESDLFFCRHAAKSRHFYPRSPCGERLFQLFFSQYQRSVISIHALLAESDGRLPINDSITLQFLSTLSLRRATILVFCGPQGSGISIHALLAESDELMQDRPEEKQHFYPRSPCGERPRNTSTAGRITSFLSTLSLRRATFSLGAGIP